MYRSLFGTLTCAALLGLSPLPGHAADDESGPTTTASETDQSGRDASDDDGEEADSTIDGTAAAVDEASSSSDESTDRSEPEEESSDETTEHGSYEWKPSYGGGASFGHFFDDFSRWNQHLLRPSGADPLDVNGASSFTFALEASLLEGSRLTVFSSIETPLGSNPELLAVYGGLEPAFAFRRGHWEFALGMGVGIGSVSLNAGSGRKLRAGMVVLRPVTEVRYYASDLLAPFVRVGFNQWIPFDAETDELTIQDPQNTGPSAPDENALYTGAPFVSVGARFGFYPAHIKEVPDSDDDGHRDDVDDCVEEPEDHDGYRDEDGCPDPDNDGDGIPDDEDNCPRTPEDLDNWKDSDGCPDDRGDADGDGIANDRDNCPDEPEDEDGYEDDDGCPDPDNDGDEIPDAEDECPDQVGIELESGCPSERVDVSSDRIALSNSLTFAEAGDGGEPELTDSAEKSLDHLAQTLTADPDLGGIEIRQIGGDRETDGSARAEAVRSYLVDSGVTAARLTTTSEEADGGDTPRIVFRLEEGGTDDGAP